MKLVSKVMPRGVFRKPHF